MALLQADVCGFTKYSARVPPEEVVELVTSLFGYFDQISQDMGVFKVCTIGDAYVATSELSTMTSEGQLDRSDGDLGFQSLIDKLTRVHLILRLAYAFLVHIKTVRADLNIPELDMRVGLHFGNFCGGVIGSMLTGTNQIGRDKLRFDVWGVDILVVGNCESGGVPG